MREELENCEGLEEHVLSKQEHCILKSVQTDFDMFNGMTIAMQEKGCPLSFCREQFDIVLKHDRHACMGKCLDKDADIVVSPCFESGVCKIGKGRERLNDDEANDCFKLKIALTEEDTPASPAPNHSAPKDIKELMEQSRKKIKLDDDFGATVSLHKGNPELCSLWQGLQPTATIAFCGTQNKGSVMLQHSQWPVDEMCHFLGLMLKMSLSPIQLLLVGTRHVSNKEDHIICADTGRQPKTVRISNSKGWAQHIMSLGCFNQTRGAFHLEDRTTSFGKDKHHHLRHCLNRPNAAALSTFEIGPNMSFDEGERACRFGLANLLRCGWAFCPSHFAPTIKVGTT